MRCPNFRPAWGLLSLLACVFPVHAAGSDEARKCASMGDDGARLACYDRIFRQPVPTAGATQTPSAAGSVGAATVAPPVNPQADFGLTEAAKRARDPEKASELMPESITRKVASVDRKQNGELVVTLDNGQVWAQLETDTKARVRPGDTVTIKKAALGSYLLVTPSKLATRVRRVR